MLAAPSRTGWIVPPSPPPPVPDELPAVVPEELRVPELAWGPVLRPDEAPLEVEERPLEDAVPVDCELAAVEAERPELPPTEEEDELPVEPLQAARRDATTPRVRLRMACSTC